MKSGLLNKPFKPPGSKSESASPVATQSPSFSKPTIAKSNAPTGLLANQQPPSIPSKENTTQEMDDDQKPTQKVSLSQQMIDGDGGLVEKVKPEGNMEVEQTQSVAFQPLGSSLSSQFVKPSAKPTENTKIVKPIQKTTTLTTSATGVVTKTTTTAKQEPVVQQYYQCYWSQDVKKQHQVLDDGILIFSGNQVQLYNSEGQEIYNNFKSKIYYNNPENENHMLVGPNFVEQDDPITKDLFLSGRCFIKSNTTVDIAQIQRGHKPMSLKSKDPKIQPSDQAAVIPEGVFMLTDPLKKELFPVYIDQFLNENMRPHQRQGVQFMFECISGLKGGDINGCILADSMGLGKTLQSIALIWTLMRRNPFSPQPFINKVIIVTPLSLLGTWRKEIAQWVGSSKLIPLVACGKREKINQICADFSQGHYRCLIISYESFRMQTEILEGACDVIIFDEGHRLKNMNMKTFQSITQFGCKRRIILTGTPLQNSLDEFYACVSFVNPHVFESLAQFKNVFAQPIVAALQTDASKQTMLRAQIRSQELTQIIARFILRRKAEILEKFLPKKTEFLVFLGMTELQQMLYKQIVRYRFSPLFESEGFDKVFGILTIMRKLLNHPMLLFKDENKSAAQFQQHFPQDVDLNDWNLSTKFNFTQNILKQIQGNNSQTQENMTDQEKFHSQREKVIIVSYWTQTLDLLEQMIVQMGLGFVRLDGSVNVNKRQELIDRFNDKTNDITVFLLCAKAGGTGLNLTVANRMILMEVDWNPSNDLQVMARVWRDGQTRPVYIYRLISCGTMEEQVLQRQFLKENLSQNVVDQKNIQSSFDNDNMKQLFEFESDEACLSFPEKENELVAFDQKLTPDFHPKMLELIKFLKTCTQGGLGDQFTETSNDQKNGCQNQFANDNIFLMPEQNDGDEEQNAGEEGAKMDIEEEQQDEAQGSQKGKKGGSAKKQKQDDSAAGGKEQTDYEKQLEKLEKELNLANQMEEAQRAEANIVTSIDQEEQQEESTGQVNSAEDVNEKETIAKGKNTGKEKEANSGKEQKKNSKQETKEKTSSRAKGKKGSTKQDDSDKDDDEEEEEKEEKLKEKEEIKNQTQVENPEENIQPDIEVLKRESPQLEQVEKPSSTNGKKKGSKKIKITD